MDVTFTNRVVALDTTESLVCAIRAPKPHNSAQLNLKTDFYDPNTGLHSVAQFSHWYRQLGADGERKRGRARHARMARESGKMPAFSIWARSLPEPPGGERATTLSSQTTGQRAGSVHLVEKLCAFFLLDIQKHSWRASGQEGPRGQRPRGSTLIRQSVLGCGSLALDNVKSSAGRGNRRAALIQHWHVLCRFERRRGRERRR